jgi:pimeloyl-ACP methyl ester carboxylesterase
MIRLLTAALILSGILLFLLMTGCPSIERKLLFYPTHGANFSGLTPWMKQGELIGYSHSVDSPRNVWLMVHGNGGQASDRVYATPSFSQEDSVFILEYPGYGLRAGVPSTESFNAAAKEAYLCLRASYPHLPVCVVGESIGSGPASTLTQLPVPPDKLVLIVPFDRLSLVAKDHFPSVLVSLILRDDWDNRQALSNYKGPVEIFGAREDTVIPVEHAKSLASSLPKSRFTLIEGGHNDWSVPCRVRIRNP